MKRFKFFNGELVDENWTGASWFWENGGMEGNLTIGEINGVWRLKTMDCENGLLQFLQTFDQNRIIPIQAMFYNDRWYAPPFDNGDNFHQGMLNGRITIVYYDLIENDSL